MRLLFFICAIMTLVATRAFRQRPRRCENDWLNLNYGGLVRRYWSGNVLVASENGVFSL